MAAAASRLSAGAVGGVIARYAWARRLWLAACWPLLSPGSRYYRNLVHRRPTPSVSLNGDNGMSTSARIRATSYITRGSPQGPQLLVFDYSSHPEAGTHLPCGGVEPGERPDTAAIREAIEETGITGTLDLRGVVGVQQGHHDTGQPPSASTSTSRATRPATPGSTP